MQVLRADSRLLELPLDLVRCESLQSLDAATCGRLLNKNYRYVRGRPHVISDIPPPFVGRSITDGALTAMGGLVADLRDWTNV